MAGEPADLIVCLDCGCLNEHATALLDQVKADLERAEKDLRAKRAKIARLESDRRDKLKAHKRYGDAMTVLRHWQETCAPKAREIDSPERLSAVLARLTGGHEVDELKLAVTGYSQRPYVTRSGRSASGKPSEWYADAELICRNAENVRRGIALASTLSESTLDRTGEPLSRSSMERLSWRSVKHANRQLIIRALTEKFGALLEDDSILTPGGLLSPCPRCDNDPALTLRIAPPDWDWIARCSSCGLNETRLIAAITEDK